MSRFANKNMNGGYGNYDRVQEQGYNGIAYSARHDATSYRAQTEQVVYYPAATTGSGHDEYMISSPRKDAPPPRIHTSDRAPEKNPNYHDQYSSPRSRDESVRVPTKNLQYWNNGNRDDNSPPSKDRNYGHDEYMIGSPRKDAPPPRIHTSDRAPEKNPNYHDQFSSPRSRDEPVRVPTKNLQYWNNGNRDDNSPPSKDRNYGHAARDYGKHVRFNTEKDLINDSREEEDEHVGNDGVLVPNNKGSRLNIHARKEEDSDEYDGEKNRRNGYKLPTFTVPINQAKKDSSRDNATRYETVAPNNNSKSVTASPPHNNSWQARTTEQKPAFSGGQETIDSTEARRRYGKASAPAGDYAVDRHASGGTIDCKEAAKRYGGVFLPN